MFHADRQTDMMKLIVAFRNFANAHKKSTPASITSLSQMKKVTHLLDFGGNDFVRVDSLQNSVGATALIKILHPYIQLQVTYHNMCCTHSNRVCTGLHCRLKSKKRGGGGFCPARLCTFLTCEFSHAE